MKKLIKKTKRRKKVEKEFTEADERRYKKISTIVVIVIALLCLLISSDILLVTKANVGPFLAIRTKVYDDGGTKEYYGLGYKVIKYNQKVGRKDTVLGSWKLKYSIEPTAITSLDLALEFRNYPKKTYQKFYGQYLKITGIISEVDVAKKIITLHYTDEEGGAYTLDIQCHMLDEKSAIETHHVGEEISIMGILDKYVTKKDNVPAKVTIKNGFID